MSFEKLNDSADVFWKSKEWNIVICQYVLISTSIHSQFFSFVQYLNYRVFFLTGTPLKSMENLG